MKIGDRVIKYGLKWKDEPDRRGEIVDSYRSKPTGVDSGLPMFAVRWDDEPDVIDRGYLECAGGLQPEPVSVGGLSKVVD
jgi:hypothetical protein